MCSWKLSTPWSIYRKFTVITETVHFLLLWCRYQARQKGRLRVFDRVRDQRVHAGAWLRPHPDRRLARLQRLRHRHSDWLSLEGQSLQCHPQTPRERRHPGVVQQVVDARGQAGPAVRQRRQEGHESALYWECHWCFHCCCVWNAYRCCCGLAGVHMEVQAHLTQAGNFFWLITLTVDPR